MAFLPKHFFKQMDEYIIEKEKDKKKTQNKTRSGNSESSRGITETGLLDPGIGKGDLRNVPRELLGAGIG